MVHVVRKKIKNKYYLYLQKSFHIKGEQKKRTEHVAYLGRADKYNEADLKKILKLHTKNGGSKMEKCITKHCRKTQYAAKLCKNHYRRELESNSGKFFNKLLK